MATIPTPPPDLSGGYLICSYTNGVRTHRTRIHVLPFSASTGAYTTPPSGEANISNTFASFAANFMKNYTNSWTMTLLSVFQNQSGSIVEVFPNIAPAGVVGTSASANSTLAEGYTSLNMHTTGGHRARWYTIENAGWASGPAATIPAGTGSPLQYLVAYLTGGSTGVVGHDGTPCFGNGHATSGVNKKLRRKAGNG